MEQEDNQIGAGKEQVITSEPTSTEEKPTSQAPRTYSEEEWNTRQSKLDLQAAEARRLEAEAEANSGYWQDEYKSLERQLQELQTEIERKEDETFAGDEERLSAARMRREAVKGKREMDRRDKELAQRERDLAIALKEETISEISHRDQIDRNLLKYAHSRKEAEALALAIKQEREKVSGKPKEAPLPDRGISDAVGLRTFSEKTIAEMSQEEYMKHKDAIEKAWRERRIK